MFLATILFSYLLFLCKSYGNWYFCIVMAKIQTINPQEFARTMISPGNIITKDIHLISDRRMMPLLYKVGQPFFPLDGYCLWIRNGHANYILNMIPYHLESHDALMIPQQSIMEILEVSDDLDLRIFNYHKLALPETEFQRQIHIGSETLWQRLEMYYSLMMALASDNRLDEITLIQQACLKELLAFEVGQDNDLPQQGRNRGQETLHRFLSLVNEYAGRERTVKFYADQLSLSPNWLSNVVKATSGKTVMDWINIAVIQKAKLALSYSDSPVYAIADELNFASESIFSRYFKRETGLTPVEFKKR